MVDLSVSINSVFVIESLPAGEMLTGKEILSNAISPHGRRKGIYVHGEVIAVKGRAELVGGLTSILDAVKQHHFLPIIQMECHGGQHGLQLADGSSMKWEKFGDMLQPINQAAKNNLLICSSMCWGAYLFVALISPKTITRRAPFWGVIGPNEKVFPRSLISGWCEYYRLFLGCDRPSDAVRVLFSELGGGSIFFAELILAHAFQAYVNTHLDPDANNARERQIEEQLLNAGLTVPDDLRARMCDFEKDWKSRRAQYLYIDLYNENDDRFEVGYEEMLKLKLPGQSGEAS